MALEDTVCSLVPYFTVQEGKLDEFKALGAQMVERTKSESDVVYYGFSFSGNRAHCREGYTNAAGILKHLENVDELLKPNLLHHGKWFSPLVSALVLGQLITLEHHLENLVTTL